MADLRTQVYETYPQFAYLLEIPEVASLLLKAVDPNIGFSPSEFAAQLYATNWWKTTSETQRQWQALSEVDPATAAQQTARTAAQLSANATMLGFSLSADQLTSLASWMLSYGIDPNSTEGQTWLGRKVGWKVSGGNIGAAQDALKAMAKNDYMISVTSSEIASWANAVAIGTMSMEGVGSLMLARSRAKYPQLGYLFDEGLTPGQFFAEHRSAIANVMGYGSPDQVDLMSDRRWAGVLSVTGSDGKLRPTTIPEALKIARSTDEWKNSDNGRAAGADMELYLLQQFGARRG